MISKSEAVNDVLALVRPIKTARTLVIALNESILNAYDAFGSGINFFNFGCVKDKREVQESKRGTNNYLSSPRN